MDKKIFNLEFRYKIWLETADGRNVFGDGKWELLKAIDEAGSLKGAIDKLGLSYRKTWDNLKKIEEVLGFPVLDATRGGAEGGKTELTPEGKLLVTAFAKIHSEADGLFGALTANVMKKLGEDIG
ncbi:MAG: LysR family transcriptional regulator [Bacteroidales bacterium]|nr:LysR family transcriptional regulator [Bacteroidales bacterium]